MTNGDLAPLFAALTEHFRRSAANFHMPGHKGGRGLPPELAGLDVSELVGLDLTELPGLDDLHLPQDVIARAQELTAAVYGAARSFFLVNGSTVGIHALLLAFCGDGGKVLLPRHCHRSVLGGLILSGAEPVYQKPLVSERFGFAAGVTPEQVAGALAGCDDLAAVLTVRPNYYGVADDLIGQVQAAHKAGLPMLVDEAHGAHLRFHSQLPLDAMACGADASVQSAHKMSLAFTQSAMLHLGHGSPEPETEIFDFGKVVASDMQGAYSGTQLSDARKLTQPKAKKTGPDPGEGFFDFGKAATSDAQGAYSSTQLSGARKLTQPKAKKTSPGKVAAALDLLQTTSPSYLLLASLDLARRQMALHGAEDLEVVLQLTRRTRRRLTQIKGLTVLTEEHLPPGWSLDGTKLVVAVDGLGLSGYQVLDLLAQRYNIYIEMADQVNIVAFFAPATTPEECDALVAAMEDIAARERLSAASVHRLPSAEIPEPVLRMKPRDAWFAATESVPLAESGGRICADTVAVYPPGIPAICPGEEITPATLEYLIAAQKLGLPCHGSSDPVLKTIRVVIE